MDAKRNWNVLNSLMPENKKSLHKEYIVDGFSTNDTIKIRYSFCNHFIDHPRNIYGSILITTYHPLDQIKINERSMFFRDATETDFIQYFVRPNNEGSNNDISRKFLVICRNYVSLLLEDLFNFCITSGVYPDVFKIPQITPIHRKGSFITYKFTGQSLYLVTSAKFLKILYITVFEVSLKHLIFSLKSI